MNQLNQYVISQALGSKMHPVKPVRFGGFGLLETAAEAVRARHSSEKGGDVPQFTYDHDRVVLQAFEQIRDGASPDSILWDRRFQQQFNKRCRELGLDAPDALLNRRLLNIRKNKKRYEKHGIGLSATTKSDPHQSIVSEYAHIIEFALFRLRYRYGASIDDVLLDPQLSDQFDHMALEIAPQLSPQDLRLGALCIRKSRYMAKKDQTILGQLDLATIDHEWTTAQSLAEIDTNSIPEAAGLIELREDDKYLYIARNDNLKPTIQHFLTGQAFDIVASGFWKPNLDSITVQYAVGSKFADVDIGKWELRLIHDRDPVFNWPIHNTAA